MSILLLACITVVALVSANPTPKCCSSLQISEPIPNSPLLIDGTLNRADFSETKSSTECLENITFYDVKVTSLSTFDYCFTNSGVHVTYPIVTVSFTYNDSYYNIWHAKEVLAYSSVKINLFNNPLAFGKATGSFKEFELNQPNDRLLQCLHSFDLIGAIGNQFKGKDFTEFDINLDNKQKQIVTIKGVIKSSDDSDLSDEFHANDFEMKFSRNKDTIAVETVGSILIPESDALQKCVSEVESLLDKIVLNYITLC
ncbi:unnamed protein product [Chironomus riparius]|uniref:Uncharacterized protein n=1 Tax=Chironomus riparius TaxID=315576 RepID=A0A9N9S5M8_9DIPT|nr:unnamed protein product [Chironomus riparius]